MFIKMSVERRINLDGIMVYKPYEKYVPLINEKTYYFVYIKYMDGTEEDVAFVHDKEKRNAFINKLDQNLLDLNS